MQPSAVVYRSQLHAAIFDHHSPPPDVKVRLLTEFYLEKKCLERGHLEIAQHEVPSGFLEGVAHCTLLISKHQASSGGVVEVSS